MGLFDLFIGESEKSHSSPFSWVVFGDTGAGKHEFLGAFSEKYGFNQGAKHSQDFEGLWKKIFQKEEADSIRDYRILLLGPQNMSRDSKRYLADYVGAYSCFERNIAFINFLISLKRFEQDGDETLRSLFAQYLFFWRAILEIAQTGKYNGVLNPDMVKMPKCRDGSLSISLGALYKPVNDIRDYRLEIPLLVTHLDEISQEDQAIVKAHFLKSYAKVKEEALNSTFSDFFADFFARIAIRPIFGDLYHDEARREMLEVSGRLRFIEVEEI